MWHRSSMIGQQPAVRSRTTRAQDPSCALDGRSSPRFSPHDSEKREAESKKSAAFLNLWLQSPTFSGV